MATVSKTAWDEAPKMKFASGVAIATLLASSIGLLALGIVNIYSDVNAGFKQWITLYAGIGPYSGKELFLLAGWFGSWVVLHFALRHRELNVKRWFGAFLVLLLTSTLLVWPPFFQAIANAIKGA